MALSKINAVHNQTLDLLAAIEVIQQGLENVQRDLKVITRWARFPVSQAMLIAWVDGTLCKKWGISAATRAYHISQRGEDGTVRPTSDRTPPHTRLIGNTHPVPGAVFPAQNAYAIAQILAWLSKERNDLQEQIDRSADIPELMEHLLAAR